MDKYFNKAGVLRWKTVEELEKILDEISQEMYEKMKPAIINNYDTAMKDYLIVEDYLWNKFFREII